MARERGVGRGPQRARRGRPVDRAPAGRAGRSVADCAGERAITLPRRMTARRVRAQADRLDRRARLQQHAVGRAGRPRCRSRRARGCARCSPSPRRSRRASPSCEVICATCRPMCATSSMSAEPSGYHGSITQSWPKRDVDAGGQQLGHARHAAALRIGVVAALDRDVDQRVGDRVHAAPRPSAGSAWTRSSCPSSASTSGASR